MRCLDHVAAKALLATMLGGTVLVMVLGARDAESVLRTAEPVKPTEAPWLTREAAAQLIGPGGTLGPLFAGVILGGAAPSAPIRERIAAFAAAHDVDIDLDIVNGDVVAVTVGVTFDGGFGYEGADVLALRMRRPSSGACCVCGPDTWYNDWGISFADGTYLHARVRVNRVEARWVPTLPQADIVRFAESLLDARMSDVRRVVGDRLRERGGLASIAVPFAATRDEPRVIRYGDFAIGLVIDEDRVAKVNVELRAVDEEQRRANTQLVIERFGRPRKHRNEHGTWWTWRRPGRIIHATTYDGVPSEISFETLAYQARLD
jgi:hypothetical protein